MSEPENLKQESAANRPNGTSRKADAVTPTSSHGKKRKRRKSRRRPSRPSVSTAFQAKYPRHSLGKALRIPKAVLEQNAGQPCSEQEAAAFVGVGLAGPFHVEISSAIKYGLMERLSPGRIAITERARQILRPQKPEDEIKGMREAALQAPDIGEVYQHYRGENLPDPQFFRNALVDKFKIPQDKVDEFEAIFLETMQNAGLLEEQEGKKRLLNIVQEPGGITGEDRVRKLGKEVEVKSTDICFVMMSFSPPIGDYYSTIYEPSIQKTGLRPLRADADIFGTGKIIDQIWRGINSAKVLVAELTGRNPNVFYELGLAHALDKPVVLVCSRANEHDVPFDLQHIRVIYYDVTDPFWGSKLIEKIAENVLSAIKSPEEARFKAALELREGR
jgi:hypothetical protein